MVFIMICLDIILILLIRMYGSLSSVLYLTLLLLLIVVSLYVLLGIVKFLAVKNFKDYRSDDLRRLYKQKKPYVKSQEDLEVNLWLIILLVKEIHEHNNRADADFLGLYRFDLKKVCHKLQRAWQDNHIGDQ